MMSNHESKDSGPLTLSVVVGLAFTDADGVASTKQPASRSEFRGVSFTSSTFLAHQPSIGRSRELVDHLRLYVNEKAATAGGFKAMTVGIHLRTGKPVRRLYSSPRTSEPI